MLGKGNKERITYLNAAAKSRINDYLLSRGFESEYLFCSLQKPNGKMKVSGVERSLKRLVSISGVTDIHPHRFRRTCATIAYKRGMPIQEIQKMLGHENLSTTQIYVQVDDESVRKSHERCMN